MAPLSQIATITMGQAPAGEFYNDEGVGLPLIAGAGDFGEITPLPSRYTSVSPKKSAEGDIILCVRATIGDLNLSNRAYCLGRGVAGIRAKPKLVDDRYLWWSLEDSKTKLSSKGRGATFKQVNRTDIESLEIPLPPLDEQRRIAAILDQADALRRKRREANAKLVELEHLTFVNMFGSTQANSRRLPTAKLGDLIKVSSGTALVGSDQRGGPYPVYGGNGINGWHDENTVPPETIVIGRVGVYCGAVHTTRTSAWVTDNALVVKQIDTSLRPSYLAAALKHANLNQYAGKSAQPLVSGSRIYPVEIPLPSIADQARYEAFAEDLSLVQVQAEDHLAQLDAFFASLQHRAFQGGL